jgi:hypothetical protein
MIPRNKIVCCLVLLCAALPAAGQENHRNEAVTGVLFTRSTFAHGYRHGYEEGYHQGNIDINMSRAARTKFSELRGVPLGYQPDFGPRNAFLYGFQFGLMAGYSDGFGGRDFRAVSSLREVAAELDATLPELKAHSANFDRGLIFGYEDGFGSKHVWPANEAAQRSSDATGCLAAAGHKEQSTAAPADLCDGYRRGLILGRTDAAAARDERGLLEASK